MTPEHFDIIIIGAGISGIAAAHHLKTGLPDRSFAVLEGRDAIGGTWDLFRYPGVRSDSDMYTLGYAFRPWTGGKAIAEGAAIRDYLAETIDEQGIAPHVRLRHRVVAAAWSTADARWTLTVETGDGAGGRTKLTCGFLFMCTGYYDYRNGYRPDFAGTEDFEGAMVHPQSWPADLDYRGKRVVVIGSGATAVTLVPAMVKGGAAHVTMLQRSPSYVVALPAEDRLMRTARRWLPARAAQRTIRWRNILVSMASYQWMRCQPDRARRRLIGWVRDRMEPGFDVDRHFTPSYRPWDQRLCIVPDGDLFDVLNDGRASMATGGINRFVEEGIRLDTGEIVEADLVITATGLELQLMSNIPLSVDGVTVDPSRSMNYKGILFSDIPNLAMAFGYTNASWTLRAELTARYVVRLLRAMRRRGMRQATPRVAGSAGKAPLLEFTSGYVLRGIHRFPRQGARSPWRVRQNYLRDLFALRFGAVDDEIAFTNPEPRDAKDRRRDDLAA